MKSILLAVTNFINDEDGASAVEYGILVAAIAAVIVGVTIMVGKQVEGSFNTVCVALKAVASGVTVTCN